MPEMQGQAVVKSPRCKGKTSRFYRKKAHFWAKKRQLPSVLILYGPKPNMRPILFWLHNDLALKDHLNKSRKLWLAKGGNAFTIIVSVPECLSKKAAWRIRLNSSFHRATVDRTGPILSGEHVHICISILPKYAVAEAIGYLEGKSAIAVARQFVGCQKNFNCEHYGLVATRFQTSILRGTRFEIIFVIKNV